MRLQPALLPGLAIAFILTVLFSPLPAGYGPPAYGPAYALPPAYGTGRPRPHMGPMGAGMLGLGAGALGGLALGEALGHDQPDVINNYNDQPGGDGGDMGGSYDGGGDFGGGDFGGFE